jgi:triacylglycerol lipase
MAIESAKLVVQAYEQFDHFKSGTSWSLQGDYDTLGLLKADPPGPNPRKEPFGFVARNRTSGDVFVTFRGTQTLEDWFTNISFPQTPHPWGHAEKGFNDLYAQCAPDVRAAAQGAGGAPRFVATGHSLGGALATLATADLVLSGVSPPVEMYNLASPRVGDRAFAREFNQRVPTGWRIVNTEDIVTTVPIATPVLTSSRLPHSVLTGILLLAHRLDYEHVGNPVNFTVHNGSILANHEMPTYLAALGP